MLLLIVLGELTGLVGLAVTLWRWFGPLPPPPAEGGRAARFATAGQLGSLVAALALIALPIVTAILLQRLPAVPEGVPNFSALVVGLGAAAVAGLLAAPTIAFQIAWTWYPRTAAVERAVLRRELPGRRTLILAARIIALPVWAVYALGLAAWIIVPR